MFWVAPINVDLEVQIHEATIASHQMFQHDQEAHIHEP
jgi:hypothetical protein